MKITWAAKYSGYGGIENASRIYPRLISELGHEVYLYHVTNFPRDENVGLPFVNKPVGIDILHGIAEMDYGRQYTGYFEVGEYDMMPPMGWPRYAKAKFILTQSKYVEKLLRKIPDFNSPVYIVPAPVKDEFFKPVEEKYDFDADFVFGSVFSWWDRKVPELMWRAFLEEFPRDEYPNVKFVNKINPPFRTWRRAFRNYTNNDPRIIAIIGNNIDLPRLYSSFDVYVSPTAGEGFGLTIAEAMACGVPPIVSNHSAPVEFVNRDRGWLVDVEDWTYCLDYKRKFDQPPLYKPFFRWKLPKIESIRAAMREAYENRKVSEVKGKRAKQYIQKYASLPTVSDKLKYALDKIENEVNL